MVDAFNGTKVQLRVPTRVACEACNGTGSEAKDRGSEMCTTCGGVGKVRAQQGFFLVERACPTCGGAGRVIRNPCRICAGAGTVQRERSLQVSVPAGVEDGTRIRLPGEGEAGGPGAPPGDLYVHVAIRPHPIFHRDGANIVCRVPLRMSQAALGGDVEVPVIDGTKARVKIPAGTQTGEQFRLRGKGFSVLRSAAARRHVHPGRRRNAAASDPAPEGTDGRIRSRRQNQRQRQPELRRLLRQSKRILRQRKING